MPDLRRLTSSSALCALVLALALTLAGGPEPLVAQEVDTFHLRLYQDGAELAASGQFDEAVSKLRLACFGMLEKPKVLAPCLGRLLIAQEAADASDDEIETTVDRLLEVERRFKGWSEPDSRFVVSDEVRRRVEALFGRFGTEESLARVPGLGDMVLEKQVQRVAEMPREERRRELNLLVQRQAGIPIWHVMSAELSLEQGDPRAAAAAARQILEAFEGNAGARCVQGRARAAQDQCDAAVVESLGACADDHTQRSEIDLAMLRCLVEAERWSEADAAWRRLPPDVREQRSVRRQRKDIEKGLEDAGRGGSAGAVDSNLNTESSETVAEKGALAEIPTKAAAEPKAQSRPTAAPVYAPPPGVEEEDLLASWKAPPVAEMPVETTKVEEIEASRPKTALVEPASTETVSAETVSTETVPTETVSTEFGDLPDDEQATLRRVRDALATEQRDLYAELWAPARKVAKKRDQSAVAQRLAGSLAFRLGRWKDAIRFLRRDHSLSATRPQLQLELAIALHYQGEQDEARDAFDLCRPLLASSAWVEFWQSELRG